MEEKKLTDEEYIERLEYCQYPMNCCICKYESNCFLDNKKTIDLIHRLQNEVSQWKSTAEQLEEVYNADREHFIETATDLRQEIERLTKKVENQKSVIKGQNNAIEKEKAKNKRLYDEYVRLDDFCAEKGCICCICERKKTCNECSKCGSLATEKCEGFKIDVSKYARAIERADKLQKQVDELKVENERLKGERKLCHNCGKYFLSAWKACPSCGTKPNDVRQAVKDTANKIYRGLCEKENWNEMKEAIRWGDESEDLKVLISEILGVEVE